MSRREETGKVKLIHDSEQSSDRSEKPSKTEDETMLVDQPASTSQSSSEVQTSTLDIQLETQPLKTLRDFLRESPETALQVIEATNKVIDRSALNLTMTPREETLCCYAVKAVIDVLRVDQKPNEIDLESAETQAIILPILTSIMNKDSETQNDIIQSYEKRSEQETACDHADYLFCKWADEAGHLFNDGGITKSLYNTIQPPGNKLAEWTALHQNALALYYLVHMQWTDLIFMRKQQEVYNCLAVEEQARLTQYFDLFQMIWFKTLHELHDRMTNKPQYGYTPKNVFNDTSINNVVQDVIAEIDQVDEQGRETMLASWQKKKNRPYSSTSMKEIVENFYNKFQQLCGKWQKMQEKLPAKTTEVFELLMENHFLSTDSLQTLIRKITTFYYWNRDMQL